MRQPLEAGKIVFLRNGFTYTFPTDVMLVAAMNPCPCGYYPDKNKCLCMPYQVQKYLGHISGPILDRIDVVAETTAVKKLGDEKSGKEPGITGREMKKQVVLAREIQKERYRERFGAKEGRWNGNLTDKDIEKICIMNQEAKKLLERLAEKYSLSGRAYYSLLKVARTIADLENCEKIKEKHLAEATGYRMGFERYFHG